MEEKQYGYKQMEMNSVFYTVEARYENAFGMKTAMIGFIFLNGFGFVAVILTFVLPSFTRFSVPDTGHRHTKLTDYKFSSRQLLNKHWHSLPFHWLHYYVYRATFYVTYET